MYYLSLESTCRVVVFFQQDSLGLKIEIEQKIEQRPYFLLLHYPSKWKRTKRIEPIFDNNVKIARLVKLVKDGGEQTLVVLLVKV